MRGHEKEDRINVYPGLAALQLVASDLGRQATPSSARLFSHAWKGPNGDEHFPGATFFPSDAPGVDTAGMGQVHCETP